VSNLKIETDRLKEFKNLLDKAIGDNYTPNMFYELIDLDPIYMANLLNGYNPNFPSPKHLKNIADNSADKSVTYELLLRVTGVSIRKIQRTEDRVINKFDIYMADLGEGIGSEQSGVRPVVLLGTEKCLESSPVIPIAPITKQVKKYSATHVIIGQECGLTENSIVLLEQFRVISRTRLMEYIGRVSVKEDKDKIIKAAKLASGLYEFSDAVDENIEYIDNIQIEDISKEELFSFKKVWNILKSKNRRKDLNFLK
jgi:mRNA interferase MazF